jgi:hypothetical protein
MWLKRRVVMKQIIPISLLAIGLLASAPFAAHAIGIPETSMNLEQKTKVLPAQVHPPYQIGYTVHYRSPRDRKWTLDGFHLERRDAERAVRRLRRLGFRTQISSRAAAERPSLSR